MNSIEEIEIPEIRTGDRITEYTLNAMAENIRSLWAALRESRRRIEWLEKRERELSNELSRRHTPEVLL